MGCPFGFLIRYERIWFCNIYGFKNVERKLWHYLRDDIRKQDGINEERIGNYPHQML